MPITRCGPPPERSRFTAAHAQLQAFQTALGAYRDDIGHYPSQKQGLQALRTQPAGEAKWRGPYLPQDIPLDPWRHAYEYTAPQNPGCPPRIRSYGEDGQPGGTGASADIADEPARCTH
ncbi:type II secretion system protein GspG [Paludibaculum fermentans]|uniref:type II secretion system protein GspG n=1 Tax=Paludibaculum fermentans TaxID=1473598 RepID=UPI003EBE363A